MLDDLEKNIGNHENMIPFEDPGLDAIARLSAIPLLFETPANAVQEEGRIASDSWSNLSPVAIRDTSAGHIRLLNLRSGKIKLELVAEKQNDRWEFVARIYKSNRIIHDCVLVANGKKHLATSGGFIHWSSKAVPRRLSLLSFNKNVLFEGLKWS